MLAAGQERAQMMGANEDTISPFQLSDSDYQRFRQLISVHSGLDFSAKNRTDLEIGLAKALEAAPSGATTLDSYYNLLKQSTAAQSRAEMKRLINLLTIGETHFFRDRAQFTALTQEVLPALIAQKRAAAEADGLSQVKRPQLRLWSAGCATGEEPYSLAILLRELIPDLDRWSILILGTDINQEHIERAKQALYSDWSFRELSARAKRQRYFSRQGSRYQLCDEVRQMVAFATHNLVEDQFLNLHHHPLAMDMILCRNVTIYFSDETTRQLIKKFYKALEPDGWLVVGHAEPSLVVYDDFQTHYISNAILYQKMVKRQSELDRPVRSKPNGPPEPDSLQMRDGPAPSNSTTQVDSGTGKLPELPEPTLTLDTSALSPPVKQPASSDSSSVYDVACQLLSVGLTNKAIEHLEQNLANSKDVNSVKAFCLLARAHANQGHWEQARHWANQVIMLDALQADAYYILALVEDHLGYISQAINNLNKVIYLDRMRPLPHFNLAMLHRKVRHRNQAQRALKNLIRILQEWPPERLVPDSGGTTAQSLLATARRILAELETP